MDKWIMLVDSEAGLSYELQMKWAKQDIYMKLAPSMPKALELFLERDFLLITINADNVEFLPLLKLMRELQPMPILIFSSNFNENEMDEALHCGADVYMTSPTIEDSQITVQQALIRRYTELNKRNPQTITRLTVDNLTMIVEHREVYVDDKLAKLTRSDFDLLHLLLSYPGQVFSPSQIYSYLYGDLEEYLVGNVENAIRSQIKRVRQKLRDCSTDANYIVAVREIGYSIKPKGK